MLEAGELELPVPGGGATAERLAGLCRVARRDLELARLVEAHTDAIAILREACRRPEPHALYGVWAAEDPSCRLELVDVPTGTAPHASAGRLRGTKAFCTGSTLIDRALVSVRTSEGPLLIDVDLHDQRVSFDASSWRTPAFDATATATTTFDDLAVQSDDVVGPPGWYLDRVGFAHGACGPAACWAGGALGLVDHAVAVASRRAAKPHFDAYTGALLALAWNLDAMLEFAGDQIDERPWDRSQATQRALMLRHRVERTATEIVDLHGRAVGPRPLIQQDLVIRRISQLQLYVRQHHDETDLEMVATIARSAVPRDEDGLESER
jgi:alkylation response protein AidB-like acyl-CoA dehydrogenase